MPSRAHARRLAATIIANGGGIAEAPMAPQNPLTDLQRLGQEFDQTHTPGPWLYRSREHDDWGVVRIEDGGFICQAKDPRTAWNESVFAAHRIANTDPWEANARLIAAAPELLEVLTSVAACMLNGADGQEGDFGWHVSELTKLRPAIRAAITKATSV